MPLLRCLFLGPFGKPSYLRAIKNSSSRLFVLPVAPGSAARAPPERHGHVEYDRGVSHNLW